MKSILPLFLLAAVSISGATPALADDPQLRNRLIRERQQSARETTPPTIALSVQDRGVGSARSAQASRSEVRLEQRWNARGERVYVHTPSESR